MDDLRERSILHCDTPERAVAELHHAAARVHQLIDDLTATVGRDRVTVIDNAVCELQGAYQCAVSAYLLAALTAVNEGDHDAYIAPGRVTA